MDERALRYALCVATEALGAPENGMKRKEFLQEEWGAREGIFPEASIRMGLTNSQSELHLMLPSG